MRNIGAVIFCIIGGILMIIASILGSAAIYELIVEFLSNQFPDYETFLRIFLGVCIIIAAGGGISVIIGAIVTFKSLAPGKFVIGIGAGMGLIGLIIFIVSGIIAGTIAGTVSEIIIGLLLGPASYGLIGVFMTIFARRSMKKDKEK